MQLVQTEVTKYIIETIAVSVQENKRQAYLGGFGENARFKETSLGWFGHFHGSWEAIYLGQEKPELKAGDKVRITIERIP